MFLVSGYGIRGSLCGLAKPIAKKTKRLVFLQLLGTRKAGHFIEFIRFMWLFPG